MPRNKQRSSSAPSNATTLPSELEAELERVAKQAAGKPLDLSEGSPLASIMGRFIEIALKEEMRHHLGYDHREPQQAQDDAPITPRENTRNGYGGKTLKTSAGSSRIAVPRDRNGSFEPQILPKYGRVTAELEQRIVAMYTGGMTMRDIAEHIREIYHFQATDDFISDIVMRVEPELKAWRNRPLEPMWSIVYIDALHMKVRHSAGVSATAAYIVSGYGESGSHEVIGVWMAPESSGISSESASFWHTVLLDLHNRGVTDILFLASDELTGLDNAIATVLPQTFHVPCIVHQVRTSLKQVPWSSKRKVASALREIYAANSYELAELALAELEREYLVRYPKIVKQWRALLNDLQPLWTFSKGLRKMIYTTNPQENINRQVRKVTKNRGVLPNVDSALRLLTLVLIRINQRSQERIRIDWINIVQELHIRFPGRLPEYWGTRLT
jgi:putative transposase